MSKRTQNPDKPKAVTKVRLTGADFHPALKGWVYAVTAWAFDGSLRINVGSHGVMELRIEDQGTSRCWEVVE